MPVLVVIVVIKHHIYSHVLSANVDLQSCETFLSL